MKYIVPFLLFATLFTTTKNVSAQEPRASSVTHTPLFSQNHIVLKINGLPVYANELENLCHYFQSYRKSPTDLLLRDAVKAIIPSYVLQSILATELPAMREKCEGALQAVQDGMSFTKMVQQYSDDTEAPTPDGRYTFSRGTAVQPFDRISHSGKTNELQGPFLTVYGYHFLQIMEYHQGKEAADDTTDVRHMLAMYPTLIALEEEGEDVRTWIKAKVKEAALEVVDPALQNILPPEFRKG
ncbi:MAG: peptidylprolyl isomerase [Planctomycetota bacterium]|nr:peptidylprolyl isomerase [Planctomycetota bacterium]